MQPIIEALHRKLIVSCQAGPHDPLENDDALARITLAVLNGGAEALRLNGAALIQNVRKHTTVPIIGIQKRYKDGVLRITPSFEDAAALAHAGANIVALDCTNRSHSFGDPWRQIIERIHRELNVLVMADVTTFQEAVAAAEAGADFIGPTLRGYTEETKDVGGFDWELLKQLREIGLPIIAEGRINTPEDARRAIEEGAWSVVAGSAITRPGFITGNFLRAVSTAHVSSTVRHAIGVDIGGTTVKVAVVSQDGSTSAPLRVPTNAHLGRSGIMEQVKTAISSSLAHAKSAGIKIEGIGIATAGVVDIASGSITAATDNLPGWAGFQLGSFVEEEFQVPVRVENDAHAAALCELYLGAGRQFDSFIAITLGTGVGGGVVVDGQLQRGARGFGGTIGHQTIRFDGPQCNCGRRGCLEYFVSSKALLREYKKLAPTPDSSQTNEDEIQTREIAKLAQADNSSAQQAYKILAGYLSEGISNLLNILDPQVIVLSGGLIEAVPFFVDELRMKTEERIHFSHVRPPRILYSQAGPYAGMQGAAMSLFKR